MPTFLTTVVPEGRVRGTGEISGDVIVSEMSVSGGAVLQQQRQAQQDLLQERTEGVTEAGV